ncbi:MAG: DUF4863 family protein [Planctomycetes bacterium]|nr:DUF4863 family protein [Planctomycetota bacterium]
MIDTFRPLLDAARGVDLADPQAARAELVRRLDPRGPAAVALNRALTDLLDARRIADRGDPPVRWSRVAKATPESLGFSIDAVDMHGPGPHHVHPDGEVNWCVALEGDPRFDGQPAGWVVMPPGSGHVPTVSGGRMLIVYLLPGGKIEFTKA